MYNPSNHGLEICIYLSVHTTLFSEVCDNGYDLLSTGCFKKIGTTNTTIAIENCGERKGHILTLESDEEQKEMVKYYGIGGGGKLKNAG